MKRFACPTCGNEVHFHNGDCVGCGAVLAFDPGSLSIVLARGPDRCANSGTADCNWLSEPGERFCTACLHNRTVPDPGSPENRERWAAIERAKRQLFYSLLRWNLPVTRTEENGRPALWFDFLADKPDEHGKLKPVLSGHANGLITLNIAEGDDAEREARRSAMGEPFRTLVGHMRHEIAHYYWELLVRHTPALWQVRQVFGDDSQDYGDALQRHYDNGPRPDWPQAFVSAYATAHPWEDFAETFAHWLHMVDGLDTAWAYGLTPGGNRALFDPYAAPGAQSVIDAWVPVSIAINAVNRSLGQPDLYPFVLSAPVIDKLQVIHGLLSPFRA